MPEMIGKYRVSRELGRGATGAVYLAEDTFNNRKVAIKLMFPDVLRDKEDGAEYRTMFLNEASLAGKIIHPHIVSIFDAVVEDEMSYIVMEFVDGGTLEPFCKPETLLTPKEVVEIIFKCARALTFAHMEGLIHRDIKPGNILYRGGTDIKVADFGASVSVVSDRTQGATVGSPLYMAPELITGSRASMQSDIYALGMVMYIMLAGRAPFEASNPASLAYQIVNHEPEMPSQFREGVPPIVEDIVKQSIAKDLTKRFQTWEEFGRALTGVWQAEVKPLEQQQERDVSETERFSLLKALPFFAGFPENDLWEVLRISKWRPFKPGEILINEGDKGDSFFVLAQGSMKVTRAKRLLNVLSAGDCFGEMSYLSKNNHPRSATITTATQCIVLKIRAADLVSASASCKQLFDRQFLATLVERLETANQQLAVAS